MMFDDVLLPGFTVNVGVYLSSQYAFVPQHFLNCPQVGTAFYQVGRKRMAERMRRYLLMYTGCHGLFLHHVENGYAAELLASGRTGR